MPRHDPRQAEMFLPYELYCDCNTCVSKRIERKEMLMRRRRQMSCLTWCETCHAPRLHWRGNPGLNCEVCHTNTPDIIGY